MHQSELISSIPCMKTLGNSDRVLTSNPGDYDNDVQSQEQFSLLKLKHPHSWGREIEGNLTQRCK